MVRSPGTEEKAGSFVTTVRERANASAAIIRSCNSGISRSRKRSQAWADMAERTRYPDVRVEPLRLDLALQACPKARAPMFDQDSFTGIEDHGCLALLEMILISELLREGDLAFRADCRRLRHRPMIGLSGIISLLQVKKYCSESLFPGHTETQGHRFA